MNDVRRPTGLPIQARINVNLNDMPPVGCPSCECQIFATNVAMYRKLSAIQAGKAMLAMIPLAVCQNCGAVCQVVSDELRLVEGVPAEEGGDKPDE